MGAKWTITGLTYDRDKAERRVDGNNPQVSCPVLFSAQCASFTCFMTSDINPSQEAFSAQLVTGRMLPRQLFRKTRTDMNLALHVMVSMTK